MESTIMNVLFFIPSCLAGLIVLSVPLILFCTKTKCGRAIDKKLKIVEFLKS